MFILRFYLRWMKIHFDGILYDFIALTLDCKRLLHVIPVVQSCCHSFHSSHVMSLVTCHTSCRVIHVMSLVSCHVTHMSCHSYHVTHAMSFLSCHSCHVTRIMSPVTCYSCNVIHVNHFVSCSCFLPCLKCLQNMFIRLKIFDFFCFFILWICQKVPTSATDLFSYLKKKF